jgi:hypothetical protein
MRPYTLIETQCVFNPINEHTKNLSKISFFFNFIIPFIFSSTYEFLCRKLGWEPKTGESHLDAMLRGEILNALAVFGHELTLNEASRRFHAFLDDRNTPLLPPDIRRVGKRSIGLLLIFLHLQLLLMYIMALIADSVCGCNA